MNPAPSVTQQYERLAGSVAMALVRIAHVAVGMLNLDVAISVGVPEGAVPMRSVR